MKSSDHEKENRTPNDINPGIQNKNYYMEELENVNGDVSDPEDTYHTIDADSIPDSTTNYNEYSELEPTITYETLDPEKVEKDDSRQYDNKVQRTSCLDNESKDGDNNNKVEHDNGIATNEYFILESEEDPNNQQKDPNLVATDNTVIHNNDVAPTSNEYFILEPESDPCNQAKDHDNIISNNNDMAPTSNDYFILEPEGVPSDQQNGHILNADIDSTEYNTINPQTNAIVKDPRYQRLGAIQH